MAIHPWNISLEKFENAFCLYMLPFAPSPSIPKALPQIPMRTEPIIISERERKSITARIYIIIEQYFYTAKTPAQNPHRNLQKYISGNFF